MAQAKKKELQKTVDDFSYLDTLEPVQQEDNFDATDVVVPRIKLLQSQSKECEGFEDARPGHFWHTGADESLGTELEFVICSRQKKYLLIAPMEDGQGVLARADDFKTWDRKGSWTVKLKDKKEPVVWEIEDLDVEESGLDRWGSSNPEDPDSPPAATLFYEYLVICPERLDLGPAVISLARSSIRKAKRGLNDKIANQLAKGRPIQALKFVAKTEADINSSNQPFKNWGFRLNGFVTEPVYRQARDLGDTMQEYKVQDETGSVDDDQKGVNVESDEF